MKPNNICIIVIVLSALATQLHMIYTADKIAKALGYFVSLGVLPVICGGAIGYVGLTLSGHQTSSDFKTFWWIPASGSLAALLLVGFVLWRMS
jgi:hypothetical protein